MALRLILKGYVIRCVLAFCPLLCLPLVRPYLLLITYAQVGDVLQGRIQRGCLVERR